MQEDYQAITIERLDRVMVISLNRPESMNAVNAQMHHELRSVFAEADQDDLCRVIVLTGAGDAFCAGGDVPGMSGPTGTNLGHRSGAVYTPGFYLIDTILRLEKPIIAMINGPVAGVGASIALFCDIVVMDEAAPIRDHHVPLGLVAGDGGGVVWPILAGISRAKERLMTGSPISGKEAARIGLVSHAVPRAELRAKTLAIAQELAECRPYAIKATKALLQFHVKRAMSLMFDTAVAWEIVSIANPEHHEAVQAWVPDWLEKLRSLE
jgi:enoyl-CoA hydratase